MMTVKFKSFQQSNTKVYTTRIYNICLELFQIEGTHLQLQEYLKVTFINEYSF